MSKKLGVVTISCNKLIASCKDTIRRIELVREEKKKEAINKFFDRLQKEFLRRKNSFLWRMTFGWFVNLNEPTKEVAIDFYEKEKDRDRWISEKKLVEISYSDLEDKCYLLIKAATHSNRETIDLNIDALSGIWLQE